MTHIGTLRQCIAIVQDVRFHGPERLNWVLPANVPDDIWDPMERVGWDEACLLIDRLLRCLTEEALT